MIIGKDLAKRQKLARNKSPELQLSRKKKKNYNKSISIWRFILILKLVIETLINDSESSCGSEEV